MTIPPGCTLGILGGGQLGRMIALAARSMGYRVVVMDPEENCAAAPVADAVIVGGFDDAKAAERLAQAADVVTLEIEKIGVDALVAVEVLVPLRPGRRVLEIVRDRAAQKRWLESVGAVVAPWKEATSAEELAEATMSLGAARFFVKRCIGGYDGRGQVEISSAAEASQTFAELGRASVVVEAEVDLDFEMSLLVARNPSGDVVVYPPALNHHANRILEWSLIPGPVSASILEQGRQIVASIAEAAALEGLLTVELFVTRGGAVLVNEVAPRVHNSYHASERACATSQFQQAVRAACDLPLGDVSVLRPCAIVNVLGDAWKNGKDPDWCSALAVPGVDLHLYGKSGARPGRKMGHLSASGATGDEAKERVLRAAALL